MAIKRRRAGAIATLLAACTLLLGGCGQAPSQASHQGKLKIVATTPILGDLARQVGGELVEVVDLVPPGADPHTYEPTLRDVREIVYADAAFSNHLLLEEQALIRTLDANLRAGVENTQVAEHSKKYGATLINLVEDPTLNTIWLGSRVQGDGAKFGAQKNSEVRLLATQVEGPGRVATYLTGTFGQPQVYFNSGDGFDAANGYATDTISLPTNAHTHMSWAFSQPGIYRVHVAAELAVKATAAPVAPQALPACSEQEPGRDLCRLGETVLTFAVGVDPYAVPGMNGAQVLNSGHMDVTVGLATGKVDLYGDRPGRATSGREATPAVHDHSAHDHDEHEHDEHDHADHEHAAPVAPETSAIETSAVESRTAHFDPAHTVIEVPNAALNEIPANPAYRFLGNPGSEVYLLAQAVLGKHVHGEIDPHLWQSVPNAEAMVQVIRDTLAVADPRHATVYQRQAQDYLERLGYLDEYVRAQVQAIPASARNLVTTHDAYGYLAHEYGLNIAGYVTPNPAQEPSARDLVKLTRTLKELDVPAVFIEPNLATHVGDLAQAAKNTGVKLCKIYGDTFTSEVDSYEKLMATNAFNLRACLDPAAGTPVAYDPAHPQASIQSVKTGVPGTHTSLLAQVQADDVATRAAGTNTQNSRLAVKLMTGGILAAALLAGLGALAVSRRRNRTQQLALRAVASTAPSSPARPDQP